MGKSTFDKFRNPKRDKLKELIDGRIKTSDLNSDACAKAMGVCKNTYFKRSAQHTDIWTVGELCRLNRALNVEIAPDEAASLLRCFGITVRSPTYENGL